MLTSTELRYPIVQTLANGRYNAVLLVQAPDGYRVVKRLQNPYNQRGRQMLSQESAALRTVQHPAIPRLLGQSPYQLTMSFLAGETLFSYLRKNGPLPWPYACRIALELTRILDRVHHQGWIHRDIKPGNILLTESDNPVALIDFGNAIRIEELAFFSPLRYSGSLGYAAPEQYEESGYRGPHIAQTDFYSLGVVLHQMLTGYDPTSQPLSLIFDFPPVHHLVPSTLAELVEDLLQRDPYQRPHGVVIQHRLQELLSALAW